MISIPFCNYSKERNSFFLHENYSLDSLETGGMFFFARVLSVKSKMASKQQALSERVIRFNETHGHRGKKFTVDHFRDENVPETFTGAWHP